LCTDEEDDEMSTEDEAVAKVEGFICGFVICLFVCLIIIFAYFKPKWESQAVEAEHKEAVKIGVGRYTPDKDGAPKFEYITPESQRRIMKLEELEK
jgi:hypothetical protein